MAQRLENGTYVLDDAERCTYAPAARLVARVDCRSLELAQPLADLDYLLLMCAHLIVTRQEGVDAMLEDIVSECLEERRRPPS